MTDLIFLKALRDKLKGGSTRSIHLNALPGRFATRLDLENLNKALPQLADKFLSLILSKAVFEFQISFDSIDINALDSTQQKELGLLSKRLNSICIDNEDGFKEHGIKTFGFGFPLIIKTSKADPKKIIKAPLFIWQLEIIKSPNKLNSWTIFRNKVKNEQGKIVEEDAHAVELNEVFLSHLKVDENITIPRLNEELLEDAVIDSEELIQECLNVLKALNAASSDEITTSFRQKLADPILALPRTESFENLATNKPWIFFGGLFGLFTTMKESIITDIDKLIENFGHFEFDELQIATLTGTSISSVQTDPSQQSILNNLGVSKRRIIQGPPGTGKSQTLTALIVNALANGLKCLVVCEKKTALDVIKKNLENENPQLAALASIIEDIHTDRDAIVNSVRQRTSTIIDRSPFNQNSYYENLAEIETLIKQINSYHRDIGSKLFLGKSWTDLVGDFLNKSRNYDIAYLKERLDYKSFRFSADEKELPEYLRKISTAQRLLSEIKQFEHPLDILCDDLFSENVILRALELDLRKFVTTTSTELHSLTLKIEKDRFDYSLWLVKFYQNLTVEIRNLKEIIYAEIKQYQTWIDVHYLKYYTDLRELINSYTTFVNEQYARFGDKIYSNSSLSKFSTKILSLVSKKHKRLKSIREEIGNNIEKIRLTHQQLNYFNHIYFDEIESKSLKPFVENIYQLSSALEKWYNENESERKEFIVRFSSKKLHNGYTGQEQQLLNTELRFSLLKTQLAADKNFAELAAQTDTHKLKLDDLERLEEMLKDAEEFRYKYLQTLSTLQIHPIYNGSADIGDTEVKFEEFIVALNNKPILRNDVASATTHVLKVGVAKQINSDIETVELNLSQLEEYFDWRKFYLTLSDLEKLVLNVISSSSANSWSDLFESWYYYWVLALEESRYRNIPETESLIARLDSSRKKLKVTQNGSIISHWMNKQTETINQARLRNLNINGLYNKKGGRGERRNSLRKIISSDFQLFTDFFPVTMVSPSVCSSVIPLAEGLFDLVIFDEASQLKLEDTYPSLIRGKYKIVSGDSQQMPPSNFFQGGTAVLLPGEDDEEDLSEEDILNEGNNPNDQRATSLGLADSESLLVYAENCNYDQSYLKVHYRSNHPYLIDFSNNAFYGRRLLPMPARQRYIPIQYIEVNGVYEELTNREEAKQVVDILINHIKPFLNGNYPSVGIATLNLYQRNLIIEEIARVKQQSPEAAKKITDLGQSLFVKNLENIQGDERDIIIISATFGKKRDGSFKQNFGPIIQGKGYKLLNVIVTRAKYKIFVCSSIPLDKINQFPQLIDKQKNTGRAIFYAYLAYAKAVSDDDDELRQNILESIFDNCDSKEFETDNSYGSESPFEDEVFYQLSQRLGSNRLQQQFKIGGFRIDLIVKSKLTGLPVIAIECDGAKYHSSNEAYAWDMFRQSRLEETGFVFYRIWSTNWWKAAKTEIDRLLSFINEFDAKETAMPGRIDEALQEPNIEIVEPAISSHNKVTLSSFVTVKNPEGKILKVRFSSIQNQHHGKLGEHGEKVVYEKSPLAMALIGKSEGDLCQLGMLELYYEIIQVT